MTPRYPKWFDIEIAQNRLAAETAAARAYDVYREGEERRQRDRRRHTLTPPRFALSWGMAMLVILVWWAGVLCGAWWMDYGRALCLP